MMSTIEIPGLAGPRTAGPWSAYAKVTAVSEPTSRPTLPPGTRLGRYVVDRLLGYGGMGAVYRGHDPRLERSVALKVQHTRVMGTALAGRIAREARALARVSHPHVVPVFDVGRWHGGTFVAMEEIQGEAVGAWLRRERRRVSQVMDVFSQAGEGLAAVHRAGLVHRDFKPANAVLGTDGRVRVLDFGLAVDTGTRTSAGTTSGRLGDTRLTTTGTAVGTPAYMAPEQHTGGTVDERTDQFSFCLSLFEALSGRRPFSGRTADELMRRKLQERIETRGRRIPRGIRRAVVRGLRAERHQRWPSMDSLLGAIE